MYTRPNHLSLYDSSHESEYLSFKITLPELRQTISRNRHFFEVQQYRLVENFLKEEQEYIDKLAVLEVQKYDLGTIGIPFYDLQNLFGEVEGIKRLHEHFIPSNLRQCTRIEEILEVFVLYSSKMRVYIMDQWKKSQVKFLGKEPIFKRFYNEQVVNDLTLPEQKISDYLKFHEYLKSHFDYLKTLEVFNHSFQLFNNIYIQMQYAKQAAVIEKFPMPVFQNILLVNAFHISIDNGLPVSYRIFCMDNYLVFTTAEKNKPGKVELQIKNNTISLNASTRDELCFEMYEHVDKNQRRSYLFVSENSYIQKEWIETLKKILYEQMVTEKRRVLSSSDECTTPTH